MTHTAAVEKQIIADMSGKIGLRPAFVTDYLSRMEYSVTDLSRAVIGAAVDGTLGALNCAIFNNQPLKITVDDHTPDRYT